MAESVAKISDSEKIKTAEAYKLEGNELFKAKQSKKAIGKYHRAILYLKGIGQSNDIGSVLGVTLPSAPILEETISEEEHNLFKKLKVDCYNNLAACLLQQESTKYEKVIEYCQEVLSVDSNNVKAQHRKGVAFYHLSKYDDAMESLQKADKKDAATRKYIGLCRHFLDKQELELRATYKAMFSGKNSVKKTSDNGAVHTESTLNGNTSISKENAEKT